MQLQIQFENGTRAEAVILAANRYEMRVVVQGFDNTQTWDKLDGVWRDESGERIEIEAMIPLEGIDCSSYCAELGARTMAMGRSLEDWA
jgi:hypothetical protein